jgi:hypothetical protein
METSNHHFGDLVWSWINALMITTTGSLAVLIKPRIIGSKGRTFKKLSFGKIPIKKPKLRIGKLKKAR